MKWLDRTHGTKFELVRHFLARMLDGEWSSTRGQWQNVVVGAFALLLPGSVLLLRSGSSNQAKYRLLALAGPEPFRAAQMADQLGLLLLVLAVTGLIALIQWQNFYPGRRDYLALAGLPVTSRQIFAARFATVLLFSAALVIAMIVLPSLAVPLEFGGRWQKNPSLWVNVGAQAIALGAGCSFVLFGMAALQGVLLNTLPGRWFPRISSYVQGALIGTLILSGLFSWSVRDLPAATIARLPEVAWAPPVWFAGLHERLLGDPDPFFARMAARASVAVFAAVVLTVLAYLVSYRRYRRLLVEAPVDLAVPRRRSWSLLRLVASGPQQEAILQFMAKTLARSRAHRVIWLAYAGAALGVMINSSLLDGALLSRSGEISKALKFAVLFWPLGTSVVLLHGIRHVFSIPAELRSNWIFRITETQGREEWLVAVERFGMLYAVVPVYLVIFPVALQVLGWALTLRLTVLEVLATLTIFELLFDGWQRLPFTCSYSPGKRSPVMVLAGYFAALGAGVPILAIIVRAGAEFGGVFVFYCPLFAAVWIWARRRRLDGWGESPLQYEEAPDSLPDLGISEIGWGWRPIPHARETQ